MTEAGTRFEGVDFLLEAVSVKPPRPAPRFGRVRGRVVDPTGKPLVDVFIASTPHIFREYAKQTTSDAEGRYEMAVPAGDWFVIQAGGGLMHGRSSSGTLEVAPDETIEIEDLIVGSGSSSIAGLVVDPAGEPVAGATVLVRSRSREPSFEANQPRSVPVAILPCSVHASTARRARAEHGLGLAIGIDAYLPGKGLPTGATGFRYASERRGDVVRIDETGVIRGHVRKLEEAEELFER